MKKLLFLLPMVCALSLSAQVERIDTIATDNEKYILIQKVIIDNGDTLFAKPEVQYANSNFIRKQKEKKEKERQELIRQYAKKTVVQQDGERTHHYGSDLMDFSVHLAQPFFTSKALNKEYWKYRKSALFDFAFKYKHQFTSTSVYDGKKIVDVRPVSLSVGLGFAYLTKSANLLLREEFLEKQIDKDRDSFVANCYYENIYEQVKMFNLNIPIDIELGKANLAKVTFWGRIGVMPSINVSTKCIAEGSFTTTGVYRSINQQSVNVVLRDIEELNFYTNKSVSELSQEANTTVNRFNVWLRGAFGINIPLISKQKDTHSMLKIGVLCQYSLLPLAKEVTENYFENGNYNFKSVNLLSGKGNRALSLGVELSYVLTLKQIKTVK